MAYQEIEIGTAANDGTGDTLRVGGDKVNDNFSEIYTLLGTGTALTSGISATSSIVSLSSPTLTGVVSFADGSAGAPSIANTGDANTGIFFSAADQVAISTGGTARLTVSSTAATFAGNVAIADAGTIGNATTAAAITIEADGDIVLSDDLYISGGLIDLKNEGTVSTIKFYCESSNAHAQSLVSAPHAQGATNTLTLPDGSDGVLLSTVSTATVTNKPLTAPVINTATVGTSITPASDDGATLGSANLNWSDLFLADAAVIKLGDDQDVTLTHVHNTGVLLNAAMVVQFRGSAINIGSPADGDLDINADDEIELNSTLIDINGNVEISGTATTTGVHTFTAVPVFPNNTVETADIQADAITGAKIADDAINSEHYTDGSIDTAHIADNQITPAKIAGATNAQTGTTYTLAETDAFKTVTSSNASDQTITIPPNSSVPFAVGDRIDVVMLGAGTTTVTGGSGVTVNGVSTGSGAIAAQFAAVSCLKLDTNTWLLMGNHGGVS